MCGLQVVDTMASAATTAAAATATATSVKANKCPPSFLSMKSLPVETSPGQSPAANVTSTVSGDNSLPGPTTMAKTVQPGSGLGATACSPAPEYSHEPLAAAADAAADSIGQGRAQCSKCEDSTLCRHAEIPAWLPDQVHQIQQQYAAAGCGAGLLGNALLGQRIAFALLEDFQQLDSRQEVDVLLAGLHTGQ